MLISGVSLQEVRGIVEVVSIARYQGNIALVESTIYSPRRYRIRIKPKNTSGPGARRSTSGRRGPWACWHAYRDVIGAILVEPGRRVSSSMAAYTEANFLDLYPRTGLRNVGSRVAPVTMPALCDCPADERLLREEIRAVVAEAEERAARAVTQAQTRPVEGVDGEEVHPIFDTYGHPIDGGGSYMLTYEAHGGILDQIDEVLAQHVVPEAGFCGSCGKPTGSDSMSFCSQACQILFETRRATTYKPE